MTEERTGEIVRWACEVMAWPTKGATITVERLDGGYSWRTYRVRRGDASVIVRIAPEGGTVEPYDASAEAATLRAAAGAGIAVPEVLAIDSGERLGTPAAIHREVLGTTVRPRDEVDDATADLYRATFADTLAAIHTRMPADAITIGETYRTEIARSLDHYRRTSPSAHPGFEIGRRWLEVHLPVDRRPAVQCHGDYRLSNLLWTSPGRLAAVLDWERAWIGDPLCDVAFTRMFSGWCAIEGETADRYQEASGVTLNEARLRYASVFERWRSYTSAMRGLAAFVAGRNDDDRLVRIGLAGEAGAWELTALLPGLPVGPWRVVHPQGHYVSSVDRLGPNWDHARAADAAALAESLAALEDVADPRVDEALGAGEPESAYRGAHAAVVAALPLGGATVPSLLQALARRATLRLEILEETGWR